MLSGHSFGGVAASGYADKHRGEVAGLILIASYSGSDPSSSHMPMLSIYGDLDGVLNKDRYLKSASNNPADYEEHIIIGGNHA